MSERHKLATEIYTALHGNDYFSDVWKDDYEERKQRIIETIEAKIPDVEDPYIVGLHESEVRKVLSHDYDYFKDKDNLDAVIEALGEFDYGSLWNDVTEFAQTFIDEHRKELYLVVYGQGSDGENVHVAEYSEQELADLIADGFGWTDDEITCVVRYDAITIAFEKFKAKKK